jgi:hypothetical protein
MSRRTGGNSISPARSSISSRPRQTTSRNAPLACFQSRASHNCRDSFRGKPRLRAVGLMRTTRDELLVGCVHELSQKGNLLAGDLLSAVAPRFRHNRSMP